MKKGDRLYGFAVTEEEYIPEVSGTLYTMRHEKHATPLAFLKRADKNKSFYIAFKTLPEDDTGVFHIIEHSVLCGSRKFPVKEPFVELLKSSLKTFLNAMTYPDRTVYPVSSRCDRDFYNLVDVYMDAVFHPLMRENKFIFMQEGHRAELTEDKTGVLENGVVYSEMKGSVSSPDELSTDELLKLLYKGTVYEKNSGGDPEAIPTLTYEGFCAAHEKYYHPSNAYIFLDGEVDLDGILPLLDAYLSEFDIRNERYVVGEDAPIAYTERTVEYELSPDEAPEGKTRAYVGLRSANFDDPRSVFELSVIADAIAGSNEAPLKKALLSSGLVEDVCVFPLGEGIKFGSYVIELKNITDGKTGEVIALTNKTLEALAKSGIDRELLEASLNMREFKLREKDFGSLPRGLVFGLAVLEVWLYGLSPRDGLVYENILAAARDDLSSGRYEELLLEVFVKNERRVLLTLIPSTTLGEKREIAEKKAMCERRVSMTDAEVDALTTECAAFKEWQNSADAPEKLDTLPTLAISDIPKDTDRAPTEKITSGDVRLLVHDIPTDGIGYTELYFDVSDLSEEELSYAALIAALVGKCGTEKYSPTELAKLKKSKLGSLYASTTMYKYKDSIIPYVTVTASALDKNSGSLTDLLSEVINTSDLYDTKTVKNIVKQRLITMREGFISSGHAAAIRRAGAYISERGTVAECFFGIEMYRRLVKIDRELEADPKKTSERLHGLYSRIFTKKRLTVGFTGTKNDVLLSTLAALPIRQGDAPIMRKKAPIGQKNEGIIIPSRVSYIGKASNLELVGEPFTGSMHVISNILSYTHLWNSIRVRGGAYGAGLSVRPSGGVSVYSYRDPLPLSSLLAADGSAEFLRELAASDEPLDGYIIGTLGDYDSLTTPRTSGNEATGLALSGKTAQDEKRTRESMLAFDKNELLRLADVIDKLMRCSAVCVFGPKEQLEACGSVLNELVEL